jgi:DNA-binding response OmpR family regulator
MVLQEDGYQVDTANSVRVAKAMLDRNLYDFLVVGQDLPDGKGCELIRYAGERNGSVRSILMTRSVDLMDKQEAAGAGAGTIIHLPCRSADVCAAVSQVSSGPGWLYQPRAGTKNPSTRPSRTA